MSALTHLARRGHEAYSKMSGKGEEKIEIPASVLVTFVFTGLIFFLVLFSVEYTYGRLIPTLAMIESPSESFSFEAIPTTEDDDGMPKTPEATTTKATYITSSFRKTIRLLRAKGGFRSHFRGIWIFIAYIVAVAASSSVLKQLPLMHFLPISIPNIVATVLCAQLSLGWTLIVISEPSPKAWFRRIPTLNMWKKIAGPTAIYAVAQELAVGLPLYLAISHLGMPRDPKDFPLLPPRQQQIIFAKCLGIFALGLVLSLLVVLPSNIILTRIQASLIQETEETIVPFDRSFGGKVAPEIVTGSGRVGIVDAWKTFDWSARLRLVKIYAKVVAIMFAIYILLIGVISVEGLALGTAFRPGVPADGSN